MNDLISRRAAIKAIDDLPNCPNGFSDTSDKARIIGVLEELPSIEPKPSCDWNGWEDGHGRTYDFVLKKGKWIEVKYMGFDGCFVWHRECSVCGYERDDDNPDKDTNYCPNCGARMTE